MSTNTSSNRRAAQHDHKQNHGAMGSEPFAQDALPSNMDELLEYCDFLTLKTSSTQRLGDIYRLVRMFSTGTYGLSQNITSGKLLIKDLEIHALDKMIDFTPSSICTLLSTYDTLDMQVPADLLYAIQNQIMDILHLFEARTVANCLFGFARLKQHPGKLVWEALCTHACTLVGDL